MMDGCTLPISIRTAVFAHRLCPVVLERPRDPPLPFFFPFRLPFVVSDGEEGVRSVDRRRRCARPKHCSAQFDCPNLSVLFFFSFLPHVFSLLLRSEEKCRPMGIRSRVFFYVSAPVSSSKPRLPPRLPSLQSFRMSVSFQVFVEL